MPMKKFIIVILKTSEISSMIAEYDYRLSIGAHPEIQLAAFLAQLGKIRIRNNKSS